MALRTRLGAWSRDILLFILLITVVKNIIQRNKTTYTRELYNLYAIHEVNPAFFTHAQECEKQIQKTLSLLAPDQHAYKMTLRDLEKNTQLICQAYEKNSPALAFLGPIGTTSIVLKEQKLEKKLLSIINTVGHVITDITDNNTKTTYSPATSIDAGLQNNASYLKQLQQKA